MSETTVVELSGVRKDFPDGERVLTVFRDLDLAVTANESVAVAGRSGSGKSTLLHILGLLDRPTEGRIVFGGDDVTAAGETTRNRLRNRGIGFVFQHFHLLPEFSVLENVLLPARISGDASGARDRAEALLKAVGLADRARRRPRTLSGGEMQRAAIARALVNRPALLLCDEPTGNLDRETSTVVLDALHGAAEETGAALVVVTHEDETADRAGRRLRLVDGELHEER